MKRLFIVFALLCLAFPAIASDQRDRLVMEFGALQEKARALKEKYERETAWIESQKVEIVRRVEKLETTEIKGDEKKPADKPVSHPAAGH
jgi:hypothetical protein